MITSRIWLIRHGETEWSRAGRHTGRTDLTLTHTGEASALQMGNTLPPLNPGLILCSPLIRARDTARLAGLQPDAYEDDLMEWDYGAWEGIRTAEIREKLSNPAWVIWDYPVPPGETPGEQATDVGDRVDRVIGKCNPVLENGKDCILIAHGHLLRILTARWLGLEANAGRLFALDPVKLSALGYEHEQRVIRQWNSAA